MSEKRKAMVAEAMKAELRQKLAATQQQLAEEQIVRERLSRDYANSVHQISVLDTALKRSLAEQAAKVCIILASDFQLIRRLVSDGPGSLRSYRALTCLS
jgi:rRNA-processing protein FCF1